MQEELTYMDFSGGIKSSPGSLIFESQGKCIKIHKLKFFFT